MSEKNRIFCWPVDHSWAVYCLAKHQDVSNENEEALWDTCQNWKHNMEIWWNDIWNIEGWPFVVISLLALWFKCLLNRKGMFRRCLGRQLLCDILADNNTSITKGDLSHRWRVYNWWSCQNDPNDPSQCKPLACEMDKDHNNLDPTDHASVPSGDIKWYQCVKSWKRNIVKQHPQNNVFCENVWNPSTAVGAKAWSFRWHSQL